MNRQNDIGILREINLSLVKIQNLNGVTVTLIKKLEKNSSEVQDKQYVNIKTVRNISFNKGIVLSKKIFDKPNNEKVVEFVICFD
jgi:hypothetical protein